MMKVRLEKDELYRNGDAVDADDIHDADTIDTSIPDENTASPLSNEDNDESNVESGRELESEVEPELEPELDRKYSAPDKVENTVHPSSCENNDETDVECGRELEPELESQHSELEEAPNHERRKQGIWAFAEGSTWQGKC